MIVNDVINENFSKIKLKKIIINVFIYFALLFKKLKKKRDRFLKFMISMISQQKLFLLINTYEFN